MDFKLHDTQPLLRKVLDFMVQVSIVISVAWFIIYSFCYKVVNTGQSMLPLIGVNDGLLMNRIVYVFSEPERFDIIAFKTADGHLNIKRIIGLPGETVLISEGIVYVNSKPLNAVNVEDEFEEKLDKAALEGVAASPVVLAGDEYFVLGDNRDSSEDSRFVGIGNVKRKAIIGKLWMRISPFNRIGYLY
jgi:signal peptidase I